MFSNEHYMDTFIKGMQEASLSNDVSQLAQMNQVPNLL